MKKQDVISKANPLLACGLVYLIASFLLLPLYRYQINPDGISYIDIAKKYYHGNFAEAINGYWGPFVSWLLVPFLSFIKEPLFAFKLLSVFIGLFTLIQANILIKKMGFSTFIHWCLIFTSAIIVTYYVFSLLTPDLLFVGFALMLVNGLRDIYKDRTYRNLLITAIAGACLYFTKSYGFYYVVGCAALIFLMNFITEKSNRPVILKRFVLLMVVFLGISGVWIGILSNKYNRITIGTAGQYNHRIFGPDSPGPPMYYQGLMSPPNETATSVREDLSFVELKDWGIFESKRNLLHQWKLIKINLYYLAESLYNFSSISSLLLLLILIYIIKQWRQQKEDINYTLVIMMAILPLGYLLLILQDRYIWLFNFLFLFSSIYIVSFFLERSNVSKNLIRFFVLTIIASFLFYPVKELIASRHVDKEVSVLAAKIKSYGVKGNIASQNDWENSLYLSFLLHSQYYGESIQKNADSIIVDLKRNKINYYFYWEKSDSVQTFPDSLEEITDGKLKPLYIYKISE